MTPTQMCCSKIADKSQTAFATVSKATERINLQNLDDELKRNFFDALRAFLSYVLMANET